ncbi:hypothetical protein O3P69_014377 [Scylla paramamosain]|uniref:Uncharacterized protein n=1 Tax=Scylla paramamosain TaxID=85552 RepID=A0AAW0TBT2_SCYPA
MAALHFIISGQNAEIVSFPESPALQRPRCCPRQACKNPAPSLTRLLPPLIVVCQGVTACGITIFLQPVSA